MVTISDALAIYRAGCRAAHPEVFMPGFLQAVRDGFRMGNQFYAKANFRHIYVAAVGKAAAAMALEVQHSIGHMVDEGLVITKEEHGLPGLHWRLLEAGHPVPDERSVRAAEELRLLAAKAGAGDLFILLLSGGASALVADLPHPLKLEDIQKVSSLLLANGVTIRSMNSVRKHLSTLKGGQLARVLYPARVECLIISDVPGDDLSVIGSGIVFPDPTSFIEAVGVIQNQGISGDMPARVLDYLMKGIRGEIPETPKPGDSIFAETRHHLLASNSIALDAAARKARELGYEVVIYEHGLSGEAREMAGQFLKDVYASPVQKPTCYLAGGETTVTIRGLGKGGRNQEFALAAFAWLRGEGGDWPVLLSAGTDGTDGPTDAAGAFIDATTRSRAENLLRDADDYLRNNDAYHFFEAIDGLLVTGPTQTNVMDLVVLLRKPLSQ